MKRIVFVVLAALISCGGLRAQSPFKGGLVLGLNASQIDGDKYAGYNKLGLRGGFRVLTRINDKLAWSLDLAYSQRGSTTTKDDFTPLGRQYIRLNYVEVPVILRYQDWLIGEGKDQFYRVNFAAGLSYGRLFGTEITTDFTPSIVSNVDKFRDNDVSYHFALTYMLNKHMGFEVRYGRSINRLLNYRQPAGDVLLRGKFLSFEAMYYF